LVNVKARCELKQFIEAHEVVRELRTVDQLLYNSGVVAGSRGFV